MNLICFSFQENAFEENDKLHRDPADDKIGVILLRFQYAYHFIRPIKGGVGQKLRIDYDYDTNASIITKMKPPKKPGLWDGTFDSGVLFRPCEKWSFKLLVTPKNTYCALWVGFCDPIAFRKARHTFDLHGYYVLEDGRTHSPPQNSMIGSGGYSVPSGKVKLIPFFGDEGARVHFARINGNFLATPINLDGTEAKTVTLIENIPEQCEMGICLYREGTVVEFRRIF